MQRVSVVGTSCSGKTTFAKNLAQRLEIPHIELDAVHWQPNWVSTPVEEFREKVARAVEAEYWVTDGNYSRVRDIIWNRATHVIWLNYSFTRVFSRALYRTIRRIVTREELFGGNRETWQLSFFSKDSILWWVITTYQRRRLEYRRYFDQRKPAHLTFVEFTHPAQAEKYLEAAAIPKDENAL